MRWPKARTIKTALASNAARTLLIHNHHQEKQALKLVAR